MSLNVENINYNDFKNICRTCMCSCDIKYTQNNVISDVFYKLTEMHFETIDELPQQICANCFEKMNEIHAFALKCNETHSSLLKCLNNYKILRFDQETESTDLQLKNEFIPEIELTIGEHKIEFVEIKEFNSANDNINDEKKFNENIIDDTNNKLNEDVLLEKSEFNSEQNTNSSEYNLQTSNTATHSLADDGLPFKCDQCPKAYSKMANLKRHRRSHSGERCIPNCEQCSKSFANMSRWREHMRTHSGERPYKCILCPKTFIRMSHMTVHMRTHSGEFSYKCEQCSKTFSSPSNLKAHVRTHSDERPYKCERCSKSFSWADNLKSHMRVHSGERPYKCPHCPKSFSWSGNLETHLSVHNGDRRFKCDHCAKSFTKSNNLKVHMRTHSGERPYVCEHCAKSFSQLAHLKQHMRTHHSSIN